MASWIDEFLEIHYAELRQSFLRYASWRTPPNWQGDLDDIFHEWCIDLLAYWRNKEPPEGFRDEGFEVQRFFQRHPRDWPTPYRYGPWPYPYWPLRFWGRWPEYWRRRLRRQRLENVESLDLAIHDRPETATEGPDSPFSEIEIPSDALEVLSPHLQLNDYEMLLAFRGSQSYERAAEVLDVSVTVLRRNITKMSRKLRHLGLRVYGAVVSLLYGRVVFLSSTYMDLKEYRRAVIEKIHKLAANGVPVVVIAMEYFMTGSGHPGHRCLSLVQKSDIYLGLFARRYGSIWDEMGISFTEAELRIAERQQTEKCIYFPTDGCLAQFPENAIPEDLKRISELKEQLAKRYIIERFASTDDLAARVSDRLAASFW